MSTPIKTSTTQGTSPVLNDLVNRMNAQAQSAMNGANAESPEQAFSRWLEKHAIGADAARRQEQQPASAGSRPAAQQQNNLAASRAAEQTLARARQLSSQQNGRPVPQQGVDPNARVEAKPAAKARNEQNQAAKTSRKEGAPKSSQTEGSGQTEETAKDDKDTHAAAAMGEGAADVRELTPPPTIQPGDSASMMAWLASLTNGDAQAQGLASGELAQDEEAAAGRDTDAAVIDLNGKGAGHGRQGGMGLDLQAWQGVSGKAEAAMEQLAKGALETDPMAGLMSGVKAGGFNQILNEASQKVRHESATLNAPFGSPEFPQALAEKVSMWVNTAKDQGPMTAELHLNPADMGPINVKISLDGQSAHVDFAAAALETRQAIEASMASLSSALNDVGLSLTGGGVSSQTSQQAFEQAARDSGGQTARASGRRGDGQAEEGDDNLSVRQVNAPRPGRVGGLDLYA